MAYFIICFFCIRLNLLSALEYWRFLVSSTSATASFQWFTNWNATLKFIWATNKNCCLYHLPLYLANSKLNQLVLSSKSSYCILYNQAGLFCMLASLCLVLNLYCFLFKVFFVIDLILDKNKVSYEVCACEFGKFWFDKSALLSLIFTSDNFTIHAFGWFTWWSTVSMYSH